MGSSSKRDCTLAPYKAPRKAVVAGPSAHIPSIQLLQMEGLSLLPVIFLNYNRLVTTIFPPFLENAILLNSFLKEIFEPSLHFYLPIKTQKTTIWRIHTVEKAKIKCGGRPSALLLPPCCEASLPGTWASGCPWPSPQKCLKFLQRDKSALPSSCLKWWPGFSTQDLYTRVGWREGGWSRPLIEGGVEQNFKQKWKLRVDSNIKKPFLGRKKFNWSQVS